MRALWKRKHGLTLLQHIQIEAELAHERMVEQQERALFQAIENQDRLLAEVKAKHDAYVIHIEQRITDGWKPNAEEWNAIKRKLTSFAEQREAIADPLGIAKLAKAMTKRPIEPSVIHLMRFGGYKC